MCSTKNTLFTRVIPVVDYSLPGMCTRAYPGHPRGCPNFGSRDTCPPRAKLLSDVFDLTKPCYCIINKFDLKSHVSRMRALHPEWSARQLVCCLYWQGTARVQLKAKIDEFERLYPGYTVTRSPEAMGLDVTKTLANVGIKLEWPPKAIAYQVAFAGVPR